MLFNNEHLEPVLPSWDHKRWISEFFAPHSVRPDYRELRIRVYNNTQDIVSKGIYCSASGKEITLDKGILSRSYHDTLFYPDTRDLPFPGSVSKAETQVYTLEADCLETTRLLQLSGYNPAVLNMASNITPGGGVGGGCGAQEENLFRRSTAFATLYQFVDFGTMFGIPRNPDFSYPIPKIAGGIYSPQITVFRSSERTGYYLLDNPFCVDMISVAAISNPPLDRSGETLRFKDHVLEPSKEKIRTIFRIGMMHRHDALVLSAFGCGAFANPPEHMAELFREVLAEDAFVSAFRLIVFAVIDDHNAHGSHNPNGNVLPFQLEFN